MTRLLVILTALVAALTTLSGCSTYHFNSSIAFARTPDGYINDGDWTLGTLYLFKRTAPNTVTRTFLAAFTPGDADKKPADSGAAKNFSHLDDVTVTASADVPGDKEASMTAKIQADFQTAASIDFVNYTITDLNNPAAFLNNVITQQLSSGQATPESLQMDDCANNDLCRYVLVWRSIKADSATFKHATTDSTQATITLPVGSIFDGKIVVSVTDLSTFQKTGAIIDINQYRLIRSPETGQKYVFKTDVDSPRPTLRP